MDEIKELKSILKYLIWLLVIVAVVSFLVKRCTRTVDTALIKYEEFQEIYNSCEKLNTDLCNMKSLSETDKMFDQFSKAQRINTIKTQLNRWVEDYNAKSKMWNRSLWKSSTLPYQLNLNQYHCYEN